MKLQVSNVEPDGRMLIESDDIGGLCFQVSTDAIDTLAENIAKHCGSEGDGCPFEIDLATGEVRRL